MAGAATAGSPRDRLFDGVMAGFDVLNAQRAAVLAMVEARDPGLAMLAAGATPAAVRRLASAAGVPAGGIRGTLRLAALGAICARMVSVWQSDPTPDMAATMAELDSLLARAERAETEGVSPDLLGLPGLGSLFARWRRPSDHDDQAPQPSPVPMPEQGPTEPPRSR